LVAGSFGHSIRCIIAACHRISGINATDGKKVLF
jgi:hypothetical protein